MSCQSSIKVIHSFLNATMDNWRNAIYIECCDCRYRQSKICTDIPDMLCAIKEDGAPVLLPVSDAKLLFAQCIDKTECLLILSNLLFQEIYKDYISCFYKDKIQCPLLAICQNQSKPEIW